jgi:hypothetical protein
LCMFKPNVLLSHYFSAYKAERYASRKISLTDTARTLFAR